MAKNSFVIYYNYREVLSDLTNEQLGKLFRAILDYEIDRVEPKFSGVLNLAFKFIKKDLDINLNKYDNICERNRKNGQNGGAPIGNQNAKKQPKQPKQPDNDNDILVSKKERNKINIKFNNIYNNASACVRESYDDIFKEFCVEPILKEVFIEFLRHCLMNKVQITNDKLKRMIVALDMEHGKNVDAKITSLQNAISGGYFDIIENKQ